MISSNDSTRIDQEVRKVSCKVDCSIHYLNLPKTNDFVTNSRSQRLHVRSFLPPSELPPLALIIYLHGYAAHNSPPFISVMGEECIRSQVGLIAFDFHGHGYSEGTPIDIADHNHLVDDCMSVLLELYSFQEDNKLETNACEGDEELANLKLQQSRRSSSLAHRGFSCPFIVCGSSLGGAAALATCLELKKLQNSPIIPSNINIHSKQNRLQSLSSLFQGGVFICPAIELDSPPACVASLLKYFVVPCFPLSQIPQLGPDMDIKNIFYEEFIDYINKDNISSDPPGLTWTPLIRYRTALSIYEMTKSLQDKLKTVAFPFLAFHDPDDVVCRFKGTHRLLEESVTPTSLKQLISIPDGLHALIPNRVGDIWPKVIDWTLQQRRSGDNSDDETSLRSLILGLPS